MAIEYEKLRQEVDQLKVQVHYLTSELHCLKELWTSLGYIPEDTEITEEEQHNIKRIKNLVRKGQLDDFIELD